MSMEFMYLWSKVLENVIKLNDRQLLKNDHWQVTNDKTKVA